MATGSDAIFPVFEVVSPDRNTRRLPAPCGRPTSPCVRARGTGRRASRNRGPGFRGRAPLQAGWLRSPAATAGWRWTYRHPNEVVVEPEGRDIHVDTVRAEVWHPAYRTAPEPGRKVFVIREADRLNPAAADVLLKVLEGAARRRRAAPALGSTRRAARDRRVAMSRRLVPPAVGGVRRLEPFGRGCRDRARGPRGAGGGGPGWRAGWLTVPEGFAFRGTALEAIGAARRGPAGALEAADLVLGAAERYRKGLDSLLEEELSPSLDDPGRPEDAYRASIRRLEERHKRRLRRAEHDYVDRVLLGVSALLRDRVAVTVGGGHDVLMNPVSHAGAWLCAGTLRVQWRRSRRPAQRSRRTVMNTRLGARAGVPAPVGSASSDVGGAGASHWPLRVPPSVLRSYVPRTVTSRTSMNRSSPWFDFMMKRTEPHVLLPSLGLEGMEDAVGIHRTGRRGHPASARRLRLDGEVLHPRLGRIAARASEATPNVVMSIAFGSFTTALRGRSWSSSRSCCRVRRSATRRRAIGRMRRRRSCRRTVRSRAGVSERLERRAALKRRPVANELDVDGLVAVHGHVEGPLLVADAVDDHFGVGVERDVRDRERAGVVRRVGEVGREPGRVPGHEHVRVLERLPGGLVGDGAGYSRRMGLTEQSGGWLKSSIGVVSEPSGEDAKNPMPRAAKSCQSASAFAPPVATRSAWMIAFRRSRNAGPGGDSSIPRVASDLVRLEPSVRRTSHMVCAQIWPSSWISGRG